MPEKSCQLTVGARSVKTAHVRSGFAFNGNRIQDSFRFYQRFNIGLQQVVQFFYYLLANLWL